MKENTQKDFHIQLCEKAAKELAEHFDTVQILVSAGSDDPKLLITCRTGRGNILARIRQAEEWIEMQNELVHHHAREAAEGNADFDYDERDQEAGDEEENEE